MTAPDEGSSAMLNVDGARAARVLLPDVVVTPTTTRLDHGLVIAEDGRSLGLAPRAAAVALAVPIDRLPRRALLAGFVNAHSHVFQRRLRGRTHRGVAEHDSFWTWREQMYAEASTLDPASLYEIARACYREMLGAGYTTVGEFHYVHHTPGGEPYANPLALSEAIVAAAADAGIRLALLPVAYAQAGFGRPPEPSQRRFCFPTVDGYLRFVDDLRALVAGDPRHTIGVAPHSVRAVPGDWLTAIADYARERGMVAHIHVSEQTREVEETRQYHGRTPVEFVAAHGLLGPATTLVHATHATDGDCALIAAAGAHVCVCPTTEGDLGDGIAPYAAFVERGIALAIGSDGQTRIDPLEELRWAEFSARMRYQRRRVLTPDRASPSALLLAAGTSGGARSLGLPAGTLEPGQWADVVAVDLDHVALRGADPADLPDALVFGAGADIVTDVWVGGRQVVEHRQ